MSFDKSLVLYTCVAHQHNVDSPDSTILAEFSSACSSLQELARQCLIHTPSHHTSFSQTFCNQTYTFLLDYPFVYFGIFDPIMIKCDQMKLLCCLKETLSHILKCDLNRKLTSFCLQGELHPIFHKLLLKRLDFEALHVDPPNGVHQNHVNSVNSKSKGRKFMGLPMLKSWNTGQCLTNKRMSRDSVTNGKELLVDCKVDVLDDNWNDDVGLGAIKSREIICQNGVGLIDGGYGIVAREKAKKIWRRHVRIVLGLDLAICMFLFGIWMFVCSGFQCMKGRTTL